MTKPESSRSPLVAILLAAGSSRRMGLQNKLLLEVDGAPMARRAAKALLVGEIDELVVVLGYEAAEVRRILEDLPVRFVFNPRYEAGMGASLAIGANAALARNPAGVLVCLADLPWLKEEDARGVVRAFWRSGANSVVLPVRNGCRGHPVCLPARLVAALAQLKGDEGARRIIHAEPEVIEVEGLSDGCFRDVDSAET